MGDTRREFLIRIAKGSVYAAPVIRSLSAPERLFAQPAPSQKMGGMSVGGGPGGAAQLQFGPSAPWTTGP